MAKICAFVCFSVLVMDAAAGILGIEAQLALNKACFHFHPPPLPPPKKKWLLSNFSFETLLGFQSRYVAGFIDLILFLFWGWFV